MSSQISVKPRKKPNLKIDSNLDDNEEENVEAMRILQATKSAKNSHEMKKFNFSEVRPNYMQEKLKKQQKIEKLQRQKAQLLLSLQILKNGAVEAILEKDQIINKLRKLFADSQTTHGYDRNDSKMQQLQNLLQYVKDLQEDRAFLKQEAQRQRRIFEESIAERQQLIQELNEQLNWSTERIESLQKYDDLLQQKIKAMEENNQNLKSMLNQSQDMLKEERRKVNGESLLVKNKSASSFNQGSDSQNGSILNNSLKKFNRSTGVIDTDSCINICRSLEESVIQTKIQELKNQHQVQIQDLTYFYENRIQTLKQLCQQYPELQYTPEGCKSQKNKLENNNISNIHESADLQSDYSNFTFQTQQKEKEKLKKNFSLGSFQSGRGMDPIDQREQIGESPNRQSLKKQLCFERLSSKQSEDRRSVTESSQSSKNEKKSESQFSNKYFQYPKSSFKKNKSQKSQGYSEAKSLGIIQPPSTRKFTQPEKHPQRQIIYNVSNFNKPIKQKEKISHFWDKLFWFTTGSITGGLLLTVGHKIWK